MNETFSFSVQNQQQIFRILALEMFVTVIHSNSGGESNHFVLFLNLIIFGFNYLWIIYFPPFVFVVGSASKCKGRAPMGRLRTDDDETGVEIQVKKYESVTKKKLCSVYTTCKT